MDNTNFDIFNQLLKSHRIYGKKIVFELYSKTALTLDDIYKKFPKKNYALVKSSIKDLKKCDLITTSNGKFILTQECKHFISSTLNYFT